jgi:transposase InsO family protein
MPWKESCTMGVREDFVLRAAEPGSNVSALCREYGVSRKTGYKWLVRYREEGLAGLSDQSRRPRQSPLSVSGDVVADVVQIRSAHPRWGARKIAEILRRQLSATEAPSARTVHRILVRTGHLQPARARRRRRERQKAKAPRIMVTQPNDCWTVDFKGWWLAMDKARCEPLTIRDAHSRFLLRIEVLPSPKAERVRAVFEEVFEKYGIPKVILTDNGPPFVTSSGELGLTKLSAWWLSLGIEHVRTRPGTPSDNGGHERMHKDIAAELEEFSSLSRVHQQEACERWRHDFNHHRPHEALSMKMPAEVYRRSEVTFSKKKPVEHVYPDHFLVRLVAKRGAISWRGIAGQISHALEGRHVGMERIEHGIFDIWYGHKRIGRIDYNQRPARIEPVRWREQAVSPMTAH